MRIRTLRIDDYEEMVKLWFKARLSFKPRMRDSREAVTAQMKASPDFFLGAFEDNSLVGVVIISCDMRKGWINRLSVDPNHRRLGIAKALITEAENVLRKHGVNIFCALVNEDNTASINLFKKCGYVEHSDIIYFSKRDSEDA
jgi:ribosomal protein S18 acetylase RimI-like enzyme